MPAPKNRPQLSDDVRHRMGVYKHLKDVPAKYRLRNYAAEYSDRNVWSDFFDHKTAMFDTRSTCDRYEKSGRYFKSFMTDVGRHHALASPSHIEQFLIALRDGDVGRRSQARKIQTVYFEYFQPIDDFYSWLQSHVDHPHVYHPVRMAVVEDGYAADVWERKLAQNDKR